MKAPIRLSMLRFYVLSSALFVLCCAMLDRLLERSKGSTTIEEFLALYVTNLSMGIVVQVFIDWRKRSRTPPDVE